ncbi:MAG: prepilin-type N-terminal cleavage/methylation domain-containing protein [Candidatus Sumerlaeia bacterium]|nr:prepilin-type N-terminal cleavage/methylation domain-containing protein [Candidatus Sumerlaeia bacterium]
MKSIKAFTLIELLIVVAIIAILAAIAVPNFLEAQTRSKVSRVKADMRTLAVATESYVVDNNKVFPTTRAAGTSRRALWGYATTPIAYITSVPQDPFNNKDLVNDDRVIVIWGPDFIEGTENGTIRHREITQPGSPTLSTARAGNLARAGIIFSPYPELVTPPNTYSQIRDLFVLLSFGPDQTFEVNGRAPLSFPQPVNTYDPTNGTISFGDIIYFRGGKFGS